MGSFRESTRVFWTGWAEIFDYLAAVREHAWEVMWGASVIGIVFTIATLVWSPSWRALGYVIALVVFVAGYQLWRAYHLRLIPKLEIGDIRMKYAATGVPNQKRIFAQILIKCATEGSVENCTGQLIGVSKLVNDKWEPTKIDETNDLFWSFRDKPSAPFRDKTTVTLGHGAPTFERVLCREYFKKHCDPHRNRSKANLRPLGCFQIRCAGGGRERLHGQVCLFRAYLRKSVV
jgi:hypothetical protein